MELLFIYGPDVSNVVLGNVVDCVLVIWREVGIPRQEQEGYTIEQLRSKAASTWDFFKK